MAPLSEEGIEYIQAVCFLKTWGWKRGKDEWGSNYWKDPTSSYIIRDTFEAYEKAKSVLDNKM